MKRIGLVVALTLSVGLVTACSGKKETAEKPKEAQGQPAEAPPAEKLVTAAVKDSPVAEKAAAENAFVKIEKVETAKAARKADSMQKDSMYAVQKTVEKAEAYAAAGAAVKEASKPAGDAETGARLFKAKCVPCHGSEGKGTAMAPAFKGNEWVKGASNGELAQVIKEGRSGAAKKYKNFAVPMPATKSVTDDEVNALVDYIKSIN